MEEGDLLPHTLKPCGLTAVTFALGIAVTLSSAAEITLPAPAIPAAQRQAELVRLVRNDCGSCHGLTLAGGLGPALSAQALQHKPVSYLRAVILDGRHGTAMPGWSPLLSESEAAWIAERLLAGFPDAR